MVVKEAEVTLDVANAQLLQSKHHAEEQEVEVHDSLMHGLHVDDSEPESGHTDEQYRTREKQKLPNPLTGALVSLHLVALLVLVSFLVVMLSAFFSCVAVFFIG